MFGFEKGGWGGFGDWSAGERGDGGLVGGKQCSRKENVVDGVLWGKVGGVGVGGGVRRGEGRRAGEASRRAVRLLDWGGGTQRCGRHWENGEERKNWEKWEEG